MNLPISTFKNAFLITASLTLGASTAWSHPMELGQTGMGHAISGSEHLIHFIFMGFLTALLMLSRKRVLVIAGNAALFGLISYQTVLHAVDANLLVGSEFLLASALLALASWRSVYLCIPILNWTLNFFQPMLYRYLRVADNHFKFPTVKAHCDIPCKIYDPAIATISALSIIRLIDIINETSSVDSANQTDYHNTLARCIQRKEEEAEKLKQEIRIIWGDYFKDPQFKSFPVLHELTHRIMMSASAAKQKVDREEALKLLEYINTFSEMFWATKETETERKIAPYPPSLEIVRPIL